ncbi:hypothetical protein C8F01DRAFT_563347 [Mycena amicta]|nr:hypothetical protein C8F01DRAFT_692030 [Mycena amicta]KAJ7052671.1 hypothetical protein C8F01DRAFT_563347 [Mycena amicta]
MRSSKPIHQQTRDCQNLHQKTGFNSHLLPLYLARPTARADEEDVARTMLVPFAPLLATLPTSVIRTELASCSVAYTTGAQFANEWVPQTISSGSLPPFFLVPYTLDPHPAMTGLPRVYPSHVLAITSLDESKGSSDDITLWLTCIHAAVIAAHCTKVALPVDKVGSGFKFRKGPSLRLQTHRLQVPSPPAFVTLRKYMYTRRIDIFLAGVLPSGFPHTASFMQELFVAASAATRWPITLVSDRGEEYPAPAPDAAIANLLRLLESEEIREKARNALHGVEVDMVRAQARMVWETWRTMCHLGMQDEMLWAGIDLAWDVVRSVLNSETSEQ